MKLLSFITGLSFCFFSLTSFANPDPERNSKNKREKVPEELVGKWLNGAFSMNDWWSYDGKRYKVKPYSRSVAFHFSSNGGVEFFLAIKKKEGNCSFETFTYVQGSASFNEEENSFTLTPASGNNRKFYSCNPAGNSNRPVKPEALRPTTYYWSIEKDIQDKTWLLIRSSPDRNSACSYFKSTEW